jgi:RimJ/RimL family protein N-acetyltransferase
VLLSGEELLIRPVVAADTDAMAASFERLSLPSRRSRFFTGVQRMSRTHLTYLTQLDHHNHEAIAAAISATREGIGVARFVRSREQPEHAEIAITIADSWQGRGLGSALLRRLVQRAREEGITRFTADIMADNRAMLALIRKLGPTEVAHQDGPIVTVGVDLTPATG